MIVMNNRMLSVRIRSSVQTVFSATNSMVNVFVYHLQDRSLLLFPEQFRPSLCTATEGDHCELPYTLCGFSHITGNEYTASSLATA